MLRGFVQAPHPTFSDALALIRQVFWTARFFPTSSTSADKVERPRALWNDLMETLCYAAQIV